MPAALRPSDFEARTNATYDALMWALSRPGLVRALPAIGLGGIIESLIDRECAVFCDDDGLAALAAATGADMVAPGRADHLFVTTLPQPDLIGQLRLGSDLYPEEGATLVVQAPIAAGQGLRLSGPGIEGTVDVATGLPAAFWAMRDHVMRFPMGFELFVIDGAQVLGLPRSTKVEVL